MSDHLPFAVSSVSFGDIQEFSKIIPTTGTVTLWKNLIQEDFSKMMQSSWKKSHPWSLPHTVVLQHQNNIFLIKYQCFGSGWIRFFADPDPDFTNPYPDLYRYSGKKSDPDKRTQIWNTVKCKLWHTATRFVTPSVVEPDFLAWAGAGEEGRLRAVADWLMCTVVAYCGGKVATP